MTEKIIKGFRHPSVIIYHLLIWIRVLYYRMNPNISIGHNVVIESGVVLSTRGGGNITIGDNTFLFKRSFILTWGGNIKIGNNCGVNTYTIIYGQGGVHIGNNVMIAGNSTIIPANHTFSDLTVPMNIQPQIMKGITIEDDVWIGTGVRILDGVTIKKGCVIGAGAVLTKSTDPYGVYVGVPAYKIRDRK